MKNINFKSLLVSALAVVSSAATLHADVLSPADALRRVYADQPSLAKSALSRGAESISPLVTKFDKSEEPTIYLFSFDDATREFLVVSADDIAPALLGYGDRGIVEGEQLNPEFEWWMEQYSRQIEWGRENGVSNIIRSLDSSYPAITPMVKTQWNQDSPYNNLCPTIGGQRCYTGCVATALSQVLNYHQWPLKGKGSNTYLPNSSFNDSITVNFANTTFDWANMLDNYRSSATAAQQNAVATLMYNVGVGVNMNYGTSSSGANDANAALGMVDYFSYQPAMCYYQRDYYPVSQWEKLVYDQLANGPVYYSGSSNSSGHAFVCDGYNGDGYFHFNWGWGGMSDGYFLLSALDPKAQGIGGSASGYNFSQGILGNFVPLKDSANLITVEPYFVCYQYSVAANSSVNRYVTVTGGIYNYTAATVAGVIGMKAVDTAGNVTYISAFSFDALPMGYGYQSYSFTIPSSLRAGTYTISPVVGDGDGNWFDAGMANSVAHTNKMTISSSGVISFENAEAPELVVNDLTDTTPFYLGSNFGLSFTVENNSSTGYTGSVRPVFIKSGNTAAAYGAKYPVYLDAGESVEVTDYYSGWYVSSGASSPSAGTYTLALIDDDGYIISNQVQVTINAASTPSITVSNLKAVNGTLKQGYTNVYQVPKNNLSFTADIKCTSGYFANSLNLYFYPYTSGSVSSIAAFSSQPVFLEAGDSDTLNFNCVFDDATIGSMYFCQIYYNNAWISNQYVFEIIEPMVSGINEISLDNNYINKEYFNLNGVKVNEDNLAPGIYILRQTAADGSVSVKKLIVK